MNEGSSRTEIAPLAIKPKFGRKFVTVLVALTIIAIASIIMFTQFLPGARGEAVTLGFDYDVGEKMTYEIDITMETMDIEFSQAVTLEMEVQNFDGENYTIRQTIMTELEEFSFEVKMNKSGHLVEGIGMPPEFEETLSSFFGVPGFGSYFTEEMVRVGESWKIPLDIKVAGVAFEGTISYELSEINSVTVPAGTYEALQIRIEGTDLYMEGEDFRADWNLNGEIHLEKATCRILDLSFDQSITTTAMDQTVSMEMNMQMQLIEHLK